MLDTLLYSLWAAGGLETEFVFRQSGNANRVRAIRECLEGGDYDGLPSQRPIDLGDAIKVGHRTLELTGAGVGRRGLPVCYPCRFGGGFFF